MMSDFATLHNLLGISIDTLIDNDNIGVVDTPFVFDDGDEIPVCFERVGGRVRFFDDGEVVEHFLDRGIEFLKPGSADFIRELIAPYGLTLTKDGNVEIWEAEQQAPKAFAQYLSAMLAIVRYEQDFFGGHPASRMQPPVPIDLPPTAPLFSPC
jgi:hypothetical protein